MKREIRNYLFMGLGFLVILLLIMWDLLSAINSILIRYNYFISQTNIQYETTYPDQEIFFFGTGLGKDEINLFKDVLMFMIISIIISMVVLKIVWSIKEARK
ncbi:MAG: hypothetical protein MUO31_01000 [Thermodesulfovibrionales bacterium]|nr:hypothetical protein [Thermodesulfovibrionales bacterium]